MDTSVSTLPSHAAPQQDQSSTVASVHIRPLQRADARALHALIYACPPLDVNSLYAYALLALHHGSTCFVAVRDGQLCGAVTGYIRPDHPDTYFLWQIAIAPNQQGTGLGSALLDHVARYVLQQNNLHFLETTISPGNMASQRLFRRFAQRHQVECQQHPLFSADDMQPIAMPAHTVDLSKAHSSAHHGIEGQGAEAHEAEDLYRIGAWQW